jgi:hypothetical protein
MEEASLIPTIDLHKRTSRHRMPSGLRVIAFALVDPAVIQTMVLPTLDPYPIKAAYEAASVACRLFDQENPAQA